MVNQTDSHLRQYKDEKFLVGELHFKQSSIDPACDDKNLLDDVSSNLMNELQMLVRVNKTWNIIYVDHDREFGSLTISMTRDWEEMFQINGISD